MLDTIGSGQQFQAQADLPVLLRPDQSFRAQGIRRAQQVDEIPATVTTLPLTGIGVDKVAPEAETGDFVIETQAVVACRTGPRLDHLLLEALHELHLGNALLGQTLRGNAGDQAGLRMRQDILGQLAVEIERLADLIELFIGTYPGHLQRAVTARIDPGGFEVVPENTGSHMHSIGLLPACPSLRHPGLARTHQRAV